AGVALLVCAINGVKIFAVRISGSGASFQAGRRNLRRVRKAAKQVAREVEKAPPSVLEALVKEATEEIPLGVPPDRMASGAPAELAVNVLSPAETAPTGSAITTVEMGGKTFKVGRAAGGKNYLPLAAVCGMIVMSYLGKVGERCRRAS